MAISRSARQAGPWPLPALRFPASFTLAGSRFLLPSLNFGDAVYILPRRRAPKCELSIEFPKFPVMYQFVKPNLRAMPFLHCGEIPVEYHFDHKIIYAERQGQGLYKWFLKEFDSEGRPRGSDWIPWEWGSYFKATAISLEQSWETHRPLEIDGKNESKCSRFININLEPYSKEFLPTRYSMLGTDRDISEFNLCIHEINDEESEFCEVSGVVSYTTQNDFRDFNQGDGLYIYYFIRSSRFENYAKMVNSGQIDNFTVRLDGVEGFYAAWTPSVTTGSVKILTANSKHIVQEVPDDMTLPRLGKARAAFLTITRELPMANSARDESGEELTAEDDIPQLGLQEPKGIEIDILARTEYLLNAAKYEIFKQVSAYWEVRTKDINKTIQIFRRIEFLILFLLIILIIKK